MFRNYIKILLSVPLILPLSALASDCSEKIGCEKKACIIETKMDIAKLKGHDDKLAGLRNALEHVYEYCTNDDLKDELHDKLQDAESEISEYRIELDEALDYKEDDKVLKYRRKIEEELLEVERIEKELYLLE